MLHIISLSLQVPKAFCPAPSAAIAFGKIRGADAVGKRSGAESNCHIG